MFKTMQRETLKIQSYAKEKQLILFKTMQERMFLSISCNYVLESRTL